jgi:hypothetical protein
MALPGLTGVAARSVRGSPCDGGGASYGVGVAFLAQIAPARDARGWTERQNEPTPACHGDRPMKERPAKKLAISAPRSQHEAQTAPPPGAEEPLRPTAPRLVEGGRDGPTAFWCGRNPRSRGASSWHQGATLAVRGITFYARQRLFRLWQVSLAVRSKKGAMQLRHSDQPTRALWALAKEANEEPPTPRLPTVEARRS